MPDNAAELSYYALFIFLVTKELIPFFKDRLYPDHRADRQRKEAEAREREDRYVAIIQTNTSAIVSLQTSKPYELEQQRQTLALLQAISQDLAALWALRGETPPSRAAATATANPHPAA